MDSLPADFFDLLEAFLFEGVEFLLVGSFALAAHGVSRATGDMDVWVRPTPENAAVVFRALARFGAPLAMHQIRVEDFARVGTVYQMGLPPFRIDVLTRPSGLDFESAWADRHEVQLGSIVVPVLGLRDFVRNKTVAGRPKDLADLALLREAGADVDALALGKPGLISL